MERYCADIDSYLLLVSEGSRLLRILVYLFSSTDKDTAQLSEYPIKPVPQLSR